MIGIGGNTDNDDDDVCSDDVDPWDTCDGNWDVDIYLFSLLVTEVEFIKEMLDWTFEIIFDSYRYTNFEFRTYFIDW